MAETALRLDGGAEHDEGGAHVLGGVRDGASELAGPRAHDLSARADPIAFGERPLAAQLDTKNPFLTVEVSIERQLPVDEERRQQEDPCTTIGGKPASQVQRMAGVLLIEQRDDDHPGSAGEATGCSAEATMTPGELVPREKAAERRHPTNVGRCMSTPAQDRAGRPQDALRTAAPTGSPRLVRSRGSAGAPDPARSFGEVARRTRGGSGTRRRTWAPIPHAGSSGG